MTLKAVVAVFLVLLCWHQGCKALECVAPKLKVTVKISDPTEFDKYEQYLFQGTLAYAIRKYNGNLEQPIPELIEIDTVNVILSNITDRFAMCVEVDGCSRKFTENAIRYSRPRFNGALVLTDDTLLVEGISPTLKPEYQPDFPTWLIPFIVITALVLIAGMAILAFTINRSKKESKRAFYDDDDEELTGNDEHGAYNNEASNPGFEAATAL